MCTVIVAYYPGSETPIIVASNRDENPNRPAEPWEIRRLSGVEIYCPLDVLGGTWAGVNSSGIFCAITNWDIGENWHGKGLLSRGKLVLETLKQKSVRNAINYWNTLNPNSYKPFNIIFGDQYFLYNISCDNKEFKAEKLSMGVHISTGLGFNYEFSPRHNFIRKELTKAFYSLEKPVHENTLIGLMSTHNRGIGSEDSVCVHDDEHRWETRSTALFVKGKDSWFVESKDGPACQIGKSVKKELKIL